MNKQLIIAVLGCMFAQSLIATDDSERKKEAAKESEIDFCAAQASYNNSLSKAIDSRLSTEPAPKRNKNETVQEFENRLELWQNKKFQEHSRQAQREHDRRMKLAQNALLECFKPQASDAEFGTVPGLRKLLMAAVASLDSYSQDELTSKFLTQKSSDISELISCLFKNDKTRPFVESCERIAATIAQEIPTLSATGKLAVAEIDTNKDFRKILTKLGLELPQQSPESVLGTATSADKGDAKKS